MSLFATLNEFLDTPLGKSALSLFSGTAVGIGAWWLRGRFNAGRIRLLKQKSDDLSKQIAGVRADLDAERRTSTELRHQLERHQPEVEELRRLLSSSEGDRQRLFLAGGKEYRERKRYQAAFSDMDVAHKSLDARHQQVMADHGDAGKQLEALGLELDRRQRELDRIARQTKAALKLEGNLWAARALQKVRKFRPLEARQCPIVTVLNLKGGVGKTTITGQLGIAMARRGHRVLMLDLDLQGSLSQMFMDYTTLEQLAAEKRLIHHFLRAAATNPKVKLKEYVQPVATIPDSDGCLDIVAASDDLAYAEFSLTLNWLLKQGDRDNRFLLRRAVQLLDVCNDYDLVLIDCPPLVNMSCINALAASDYLLIPVTLGQRSMDRVPALLKRFLRDERFRKSINHSLHVLGLVANRVQREGMTSAERSAWDQLAVWCQEAYDQNVKRFDTAILQLDKDIRQSEAVGALPPADGRLAQLFDALAAEIEQELPNECRIRAKALS